MGFSARITATRSDALAAGASYPALTVTVSVASSAPTSVTNTATVSGGGEINTANDTANDPTTITSNGFVAHYDFGTATSPVQAGYTQVTPTTKYSSALKYGWQSGTIGARDRGTGTSLDRDLNFTHNGTFAVDLPNGQYQVDMILGDLGSYLHDNMGIFLEGTQVDSVSTAAGQVVSRSYTVNVTNGLLNLELKDLGGTDPNVCIEALDIALLQLTGG
ncbi:MAG: hypothetical protein ABSF26_09695 [Thermoguttaceae bacterium]|jgi:fibronectin type 3 domain-containing protein